MELDLDLLVSVCSDLGAVFVNDKGEKRYKRSDDCLACLQDLQRFLRRDDPDLRTVFFKLASFETARTDLVPLITTYPGDMELVTNALKVLTFLTMPVDMSSADPDRQHDAQRAIKALFTKPEPVAVVVSLVAKPLSKHPRMSTDDAAMVQLVLAFFRNLLLVPDDQRGGKAAGPARLQAALLSMLFSEHVMELVTTVCAHAGSHPFRDELPTLLSLVASVVSGVGAHDLAAASQPHASSTHAAQPQPQPQVRPGEASGASHRGQRHPAAPTGGGREGPVDAALEESLRSRQVARAAVLARGPRIHSRARATFMRVHDEHSEKAVYLANRFDRPELGAAPPPPTASQANDMDADVVASTLSSELCGRLRGWVGDMLAGGYNMLMGAARRELEPGLGISRLEPSDFIHFLRIAKLFTGYARIVQHENARAGTGQPSGVGAGGEGAGAAGGDGDGDGDSAAPPSPFSGVSATLGWDTFHLVHTLWLGQIDVHPKDDSKNVELEHCCLGLLKELLQALDAAQQVGSERDRTAADRLQRRLLHNDLKSSGLLPVLARMMRGFNPKMHTRQQAADLLQAMHAVLRMLDRLAAAEQGGFRVRQRRVGGGRRPKPVAAPVPESDEDGARARGGASDAEGGAAQPRDGDEGGGGPNAADGSAEQQPGARSDNKALGDGDVAGTGRARDPLAELYSEDSFDEGGIDGGSGARHEREVALDLGHRLRQELASAAVVSFVVTFGLRLYATNSAATNAAVHAILARLALPEDAGGLNAEPLLWQLSVMRVMHTMLSDRAIRTKARLPQYQDLLKLATKVVRGLFAKLVPPEAPPQPRRDGLDAGEGSDGGAGQRDTGAPARDDGPGHPTAPAGVDGVPDAHAEEVEDRRRTKEAQINNSISGMLFLDLLFWKSPMVVQEVQKDYLLKDAEALENAGGGQRRARAARAADLGADQDADQHEGAETAAAAGGDGTAGAGGGDLDARARVRMLKQAVLKGKGRGARSTGGANGSRLNPDGQEHLRQLFEAYNCSRTNLDVVASEFCSGAVDTRMVERELRAMGLKWGKLTDNQVDKLRDLWERYQLDPDHKTLIAASMTGGWTSKQIGNLLRKHGLVEGTRRKGHHDGWGSDDDDDDAEGGVVAAVDDEVWDSADEACARELQAVDDGDIKEAWERLAGQTDSMGKMCEELAVANDLSAAPTERAVRRRLVAMGLVSSGAMRRRKKASSNAARVDKATVRALFEEHKDSPDALNQITARLPGGPWSAQQVQRLLAKHGLVGGGGASVRGSKRKARAAAEREELSKLLLKHAAAPNCLELIAKELPGVEGPKQVQRLLRKHGLVEATKRRQHRRGRAAPHTASPTTGPSQAQRTVPEPDASGAALQLSTLQHAHESGDGRWMCAREAAQWVLAKLKAAEKLWELTQPPHVDYALTMNDDDDERFFMSDNAQDLLEALGFRNDVGDFYKVPGNAGPMWRQRVRNALHSALESLERKGELRTLDAEAASSFAAETRAGTAAAAAAAAEAEAAAAIPLTATGDQSAGDHSSSSNGGSNSSDDGRDGAGAGGIGARTASSCSSSSSSSDCESDADGDGGNGDARRDGVSDLGSSGLDSELEEVGARGAAAARKGVRAVSPSAKREALLELARRRQKQAALHGTPEMAVGVKKAMAMMPDASEAAAKKRRLLRGGVLHASDDKENAGLGGEEGEDDEMVGLEDV